VSGAVLAALTRIEALAVRIAETLEARARERTVLGQDELLRLTGLSQKAALRRQLKKAGIPFKEVNGHLFTTEEALTAAMCGRAKTKKGPNWDSLRT
jgi:hypothetical protein